MTISIHGIANDDADDEPIIVEKGKRGKERRTSIWTKEKEREKMEMDKENESKENCQEWYEYIYRPIRPK